IRADQLLEAIDNLGLGASQHGPTPHSEAQPFDRAATLARVDGDMGVLREMVSLFLDQCPRLVEEIEASIAAEDGDRLKLAAHTLKGSVGAFNCDAAYELAQQLERIGRNDSGGAEEPFRALLAILDQLKPALIEMVTDRVR